MSRSNTKERHKFWADIMERYEKSGLTRKDFCSENNLNLNKFRNWRFRIKKKYKGNKKATSDNKFIPLVVTDPPILKEAAPTYTIDLKLDPSGSISISIPPQFNLECLRNLLTVIRRAVC